MLKEKDREKPEEVKGGGGGGGGGRGVFGGEGAGLLFPGGKTKQEILVRREDTIFLAGREKESC